MLFKLIRVIQYLEAIKSFDKPISINQKYDDAWSNKGLTLQKLQQYKGAISSYDEALSISINESTFSSQSYGIKFDFQEFVRIFEIGMKSEAKKFYLAALEQGSNENDYIKKQLSKI